MIAELYDFNFKNAERFECLQRNDGKIAHEAIQLGIHM